MDSSNYVHIEVEEILKETDNAFLVRLEDDIEIWLPKSQISDYSDYRQGDKGCSMSITKWIADKNDIEV